LGYSDANAHVAAATNLTSTGDYGLGYNVYAVPTGQYLIGDNGKLNPNATLGNIVDYKGFSYLLRPDNWLDNVYRTSLRQEYNVSATAGSNDASFYASFNYLANDGITDNSDFNRITGRLKADWQIKPWLKVGANMDYAHFDGKLMSEDGSSASSGNLLAIATQVAPIYPLFIRDGDGNIRYDSNGIMRYDFGNGDNGGGSRPFLNNTNAVFANIYDTNSYEGNAVNAVGFFEVRFLKDFKFTSTNSVYVLENRSTQVTNPYYGGYATSNGIVSKAHTRTLSYNYQQLLNYKRDFNDHSVEVMVGHEAYRTKGYALSAYKSNMFDPSNHELNGAVTDGSPASYTTDYNTEGFFGRAQYDYKDTYFASGSYRRDGSSRFHPDHRWGNFWSLSGAWMLSKEEWFEVDWLNELKLKASYGSQGNDNIGNYRYTNTYTLVVSSGRPAVVPVSTKGNKEITWETNGNFNVGLEFALFDSRLTGSVDYFNRKTTDMLFTFPLPVSYGYTSYYANIGDMLNNGVEVDLEGQIIKNNDMEWSVNANITYYKNKISYLPEERKSMTVDGVSGFSSGNYFYGEGAPLYTFHMPRYAGVNEKGETLFYKNVTDEQGNTTLETTTSSSEASDYLCGTALPDAYGGFGTTFKYKGFDLSLDFVYQLGGQVYDGDYASMMSSPMTSSKGRAIHADILNSWTPDNTSSNIPRYQFNDQFTAATSDRFLIDASYLSLQNIMAGYTLPSRLCRTIGLEKLRVYVACDNVWLWSKRQGLDPRQSISGSVTNSYYAPIRTISGGVTLTF
jgi:TonB-linked SusC/RagA family outer membrane protein